MTTTDATQPVPPHRVTLRHEEVMAAALASRSRSQGGSVWLTPILFALLLAAVWVGHLLAFWLAQRLPFPLMFGLGPWLPVAIPATLALIAVKIALDIENARTTRAYLRRLAAIGSPLERTGTYEVTREALVLHTDRLVLAPRWHAIDTVERGDKGWVVSADQLHFLIPFDAFADADAQRPLLAAITQRMTPESRARSREAVEFAERSGPDPVASRPPCVSDERPLPAAPAGEPPAGAGWLTQEQASWAAGLVYGRIARPGFHRWAYPLTGAVTGLVVGMLVVGLFAVVAPLQAALRYPALVAISGMAIPLVFGAWGLALAHRRLAVVLDKAWRGGLADRGVPEQIEARWTLTATGLSYETARFSGEAPYASIHQVLSEHGYLIAATDTLTLCIPDSAFATPDDAHAFMAALLARIPEPARERSTKVSDAPTAS